MHSLQASRCRNRKANLDFRQPVFDVVGAYAHMSHVYTPRAIERGVRRSRALRAAGSSRSQTMQARTSFPRLVNIIPHFRAFNVQPIHLRAYACGISKSIVSCTRPARQFVWVRYSFRSATTVHMTPSSCLPMMVAFENVNGPLETLKAGGLEPPPSRRPPYVPPVHSSLYSRIWIPPPKVLSLAYTYILVTKADDISLAVIDV
ncbi:hypothetical protein D9619_007655 [Psilocybe cf. subviscida]|uniref:Uncharacterized protein n=1 Tax=Psilocybe cf. subviscida TaxID=2480587 RepID=A0A8H5AU69_9AGAR|nr:hypothetical protein D9619_007655 [Psilocybe cf. subviscida]